LVIHETQLSYSQEGIIKILDVGEWWDKTTNGLPVPLGINVMRDSFGLETIKKFDKFLQESIEFGLKRTDDAMEYAMKYGRGKPRALIEKFVKMYVNDVTINMGKNGEKSIRKLFEMALQKNLVPKFNLKIA
jgi:1,4-dihydroxy-6-naphthoate synthase